MNSVSFLFILAGVLAAGTGMGQRPAQPPMSRHRYTPEKLGYRLAWEDQFNGHRLDTSKWKVRGLGPRAIGYVSEEAVKVEDGCLKLYALQKGDSLLIGAVGSEGLFMSRYGFYECRAQLQRSPGCWGAFWLQSPLLSNGDDPASDGAEIDIMEFFRKLGPDIVSHNVHWGPYGPGQHTTHGMQSYLKGVSKGFHLFGLEWTPEKYRFYIDGYKFYEVDAGVSRIGEYMILSMELPHSREEISKTVFPDVFIVDYVKWYNKTAQ